MKALSLVLLAASLAANALCIVWFAGQRSNQAPASHDSVAHSNAAEAAPKAQETWAQVQDEDPRAFVERLRASGFPPYLVRALLAAQLQEANAAQRKALTASLSDTPFWKNSRPDPEAAAALRQLDREQAKLVREILGNNPEDLDPLERAQNLRRDLSYLAPEKAVAVRQLTQEFDERRADLFAAGFSSAADREKLTALEKQLHESIARTLTSSELFEYDLRTSATSITLRDELSAFNPSEQEFRAIYALRAPFDQQFPRDFAVALVPDAMARRAEAEKQLREQIAAQLGPVRAAEFQRMTDSNYRRTSQLVARLELPPAVADQLYAVQKEYEQRRTEYYRNAGGTATREQTLQQMSAWEQEAASRVAPLLGDPRHVETYKQYGGNWLMNFTPRPPPRPPTKQH